MKIATVNPIPAALPVANRDDFDASLGISAIFTLFAPIAAKRTPSGLPTTSPKKMPHAISDCDASLMESDVIVTPVFANAKRGTTKNVLTG